MHGNCCPYTVHAGIRRLLLCVRRLLCLIFAEGLGHLHGTPVDVFESASERRGADGIDAIYKEN
jgi:hypothetical protein